MAFNLYSLEATNNLKKLRCAIITLTENQGRDMQLLGRNRPRRCALMNIEYIPEDSPCNQLLPHFTIDGV